MSILKTLRTASRFWVYGETPSILSHTSKPTDPCTSDQKTEALNDEAGPILSKNIEGHREHSSQDEERRNRVFAEYERWAFNDNMTRMGVDDTSSYIHNEEADTLHKCINQQVQSDISVKIQESTQTGQTFSIIPTKELVDSLTNLNLSMERTYKNSKEEAAKIAVDENLEGWPELEQNRIRQSLSDLQTHLTRLHEPLECPHRVMLRMTGFHEWSFQERLREKPFELLLSPCIADREGANWQEASCTLVSALNLESAESENETICTIIEHFQIYDQVARFIFNSRFFCLDQKPEDLLYPSVDTHITLRELLGTIPFSEFDSGNPAVYSKCDRYLLSLNLAHSLYYLVDGNWGSCTWTADDLIFLGTRNTGSGVLHGRHTPYVCFSLGGFPKMQGFEKKREPRTKRLLYPMWIALAQILLEIHLGKSLDSATMLSPKARRSKLKEVARKELSDPELYPFHQAITACLDIGMKFRNTPLTQLRKKEREFIHDEIIAKLKETYAEWESVSTGCLDLQLNLQAQIKTTGLEKVVESRPASIGGVQCSKNLREDENFDVPHGTAGLSLYDDEIIPGNHDMEPGKKFFSHMKRVNMQYIEPIETLRNLKGQRGEKIRIAVLDSGVAPKDPFIRGALKKHRINGVWGPHGDADFHDVYGHGTHVARLLLETAPLAEIYVAKISEDKHLHESRFQVIVEALEWAIHTADAHIITMSFGIQRNVPQITKVIEKAIARKKLVFAAAANEGGLSQRAFPASLPGVICVHASDGFGNRAPFSPWPERDTDNFSTIGVGIQCSWDGKSVPKSGTSFATPVAAGIAANVLEFARARLTEEEDDHSVLFQYRSMREFLREISKPSPEAHAYHFIKPWNIFSEIDEEDPAEPQRSWERVSKELRDFLNKGYCPSNWAQ